MLIENNVVKFYGCRGRPFRYMASKQVISSVVSAVVYCSTPGCRAPQSDPFVRLRGNHFKHYCSIYRCVKQGSTENDAVRLPHGQPDGERRDRA